MRIVITGVNGFVGSYICNMLRTNKEYEVIGIGRGEKRIDIECQYINIDISCEEFLEKVSTIIGRADVIIHAAACIDKDDFNLQLINANCIGTMNVAKLAQVIECRKVIYISSIPVIGIPKILPITEEHNTTPLTMYHATKLMGETTIMLLKKYNILPICLRIPSPIGNGMKENTIFSVFLKKMSNNEDVILYGQGKRTQNYVDIRDICEAIRLSIIQKREGIYNIAAEKSYSNVELAYIMKEQLNAKSNIKFNGLEDVEENLRWEISIDKAKEELGYYPQYDIKDTIKDMVKG